MSLVIALIVLAYIAIGAAVVRRGMNHAKANALSDHDYFVLSIQDMRPSMSVILPQIVIALGWPLVLAHVAFTLFSYNTAPEAA